MSNLRLSDYSSYSIVISGDTRKYKDELKDMGGKYNSKLKNGPGWIFSKKKEDKLKSFIESTTTLLDDNKDINKGEIYHNKNITNVSEKSNLSNILSTILDKLDNLETKIDKLIPISKKKLGQVRTSSNRLVIHPQENILKSSSSDDSISNLTE